MKNHSFQKKKKNEIMKGLNMRFKILDADMSPLKYSSDIRSERKGN